MKKLLFLKWNNNFKKKKKKEKYNLNIILVVSLGVLAVHKFSDSVK